MNQKEKLTLIAENLWTVDSYMAPEPIRPIFLPRLPKFLGRVKIRMTIVRLNNGKLWIHSPVSLTPALKTKIDQLGPVKFIIAPNLFHHLHVTPYLENFQNSILAAPTGLREKRQDLLKISSFEDHQSAWLPDLEQIPLEGHQIKETAFFHPISRTLIVADLCYNIQKNHDFFEKLFFRMVRAYGKVALPFYHRRIYAEEPRKLKNSLEKILKWDFDRIILSHGSIVQTGGKEAFKKIWSWAL